MLVLIYAIGAIGSSLEPSSRAAPVTAAFSTANIANNMYVHERLNIREAPSVSTAIIRTAEPGELLRVGDVLPGGGWRPVLGVLDSDTVGFAKADLLFFNPPPPLQIASWNWTKDPDFAGDGAIIWTAVVRNNTTSYVRNAQVEITTYDDKNEVVDTDWSYATGLSPGGTASVKGYATYYGREKTASIRIVK